MNTNNGNNEDDERAKLLAIFPAEIWQLAFEKLEDSVDSINASKASLVFRTLLEPLRTVYLFSEVLKLLDTKKYLTFKDTKAILNWRQVCSKWKATIDTRLQIRPYQSDISKPGTGERYRMISTDLGYCASFDLYKFSIEKIETEVLPEMENPIYKASNCPFPSRQLKLVEDNYIGRYHPIEMPEDDNQIILRYRQATLKFLEKVGQHIWHLTIQIWQSPIKAYQTLVKYVNLMPNLKTIYISRAYGLWDHEGYQAFEAQFAENPLHFPELKNLETLTGVYVAGPILKEIFSSNPVKNIDLRCRASDANYIANVQNPEKLAIHLYKNRELERMSENWRLTKLRLYTSEEEPAINLEKIIKKVASYRETLIDFSVEVPMATSSDAKRNLWKVSKLPLNLSNLKRLYFKVRNFCVSIDFLLGMENLEYLFLCLSHEENDNQMFCEEGESKEIINLNEGENRERFMECNIWGLMSKLTEVEIGRENWVPVTKYKRGRAPVHNIVNIE